MADKNLNLGRIHGFDALRAIMMLLGLVLHAAMTYSDINYGDLWPLKDPLSKHHFFHGLIEFIHVFRMPTFFVIAGFFGALLFYKKGPAAMISNRLNRIVYPYFIALFILWPLVVFAFIFSNQMLSGTDKSIASAVAAVFQGGLIPRESIHLWFLYYLALLSFISFAMALSLKRFNYKDSKLKVLFERSHNNVLLALFPLASVTFFTLYRMQSSFAITSTSFIPDLNTTMFYIAFYWYGWLLYISKQLISKFIKPAWFMLFLGIIFFFIKLYFDKTNSPSALYFAIAANALSAWFIIFASMGLFLRYAANGSILLRYISDSAYWVYLIHLPLIVLIAGLVSGLDIPAFIKFSSGLLLTSIICYVTYHYGVRNTFIGLFLNGRKYPRKIEG